MENSPTLSRQAPHVGYGGRKKLWGNVPALDLLQLKDNEGLTASQDLSILLAGMVPTFEAYDGCLANEC